MHARTLSAGNGCTNSTYNLQRCGRDKDKTGKIDLTRSSVRWIDQANLHLHVEIENLKQRLLERERHIVKMETNFLKEAEKFPNGEFAAVMEQLLTWQEKYSR